MRSIIKRVLMLLAVLILAAGGSGCMFTGMSSDEHKAEVLKYLEDKYGEKFEIYGVKNASWAYDFKTAYCRPVAHPEEEFEVRRSKEKGISKYINFDGYALHLMNRQLRAYIEEITQGQWEDFKISTSISTQNTILDADFKKDMTLSEFIKLDKWQLVFFNIGIYINVKDLNKNDAAAMDAYFAKEPEKLYKIYKQYTDDGYYASFLMIYYNDNEYKNLDLTLQPSTQKQIEKEEQKAVFWTIAGHSSDYYYNTVDSIKELYDDRNENEGEESYLNSTFEDSSVK